MAHSDDSYDDDSGGLAVAEGAAPPAAARQVEPAWRLLAGAIGGPQDVVDKLLRTARGLAAHGNRREFRRRCRRLRQLGLIDEVPTGPQLVFGSLDMIRFFLSPGSADYYRRRGIGFGFHQVLRVLDDPLSMVDPIGITSTRDTIIGHLMQVVHVAPVYDLQLLSMFEDGFDSLEAQVRAVLDGTHPRTASITATVEDPLYHRRLLDILAEYRRDPKAYADRPPVLEPLAERDEDYRLASFQFDNVPGAFRYFSRLPKGWRDGLRRFRRCASLDHALLDEDLLTRRRPA